MKKQKLAKGSPWVLAAACTLLTLIIGVFAVNNYQREKKLMTEALLQQGITIVRFVMSSSRASLRGNLKNIHVAMWQWTDHVQQAIETSAGQPGVQFLGLIDPDGHVLSCSENSRIGTKIDGSTLNFIKTLDNNSSKGSYRVKKNSAGTHSIFQVATPYFPLGLRNLAPRALGKGSLSRDLLDELRIPGSRGIKKWRQQLQELSFKNYILLVELDMSQFNKAVRRQLLQILFLSLVLLLVGIGGWLSLLTLQGLKGSQSSLRRIREFTDILIASLPVGLIATGNDGNIRIYNQSAEKIVGMSSLEVLGYEPNKVLPPELSTVLNKKDYRSFEPSQQEISLVDQNARSRSLLLVALPVVDSENRFAGNTLLIQDLSKIKDLEKEVRRNERLAALGKMAAGLAHELRNPLSSIKGLAVLLKTKLKRDKQGTDTADILVQEVERLNRSIGELLDYSRPFKLHREVVLLSDVLDKATSLIKVDADSVNVILQSDYRKDPLYTYADQDKLNQVFLNLFLNGIQAMENGGILKIATYPEGDKVICRVEDTGCGLDLESVSKVFDPYFTTKSDGTGLGLAMSARIIEEHSGSIEFKSVVGSGTVVKINLPLYREGS